MIIIGAGVSGISAASKLLENNIDDFIILEAMDRIGGRIHSIKFGKTMVDVGGQFIHSGENDIVYDIAKDFMKESKSVPTAYYSDGRQFDRGLYSRLFKIVDHQAPQDGNDHISIGAHFLKTYEAQAIKKYENTTKLHAVKDFLGTLENEIRAREATFDWFKPALKNHFRGIHESKEMHWNGLGYKVILDILINKTHNKIPERTILNKYVTQIIWDDSSNNSIVEVKCEDGTIYEANHVIFTGSVGVLKAIGKTLFKPELPKHKLEGIEVAGFDGVVKILMRFEQSWWNEIDLDVVTVWRKDDKTKLKEYGLNKTDLSWISSVYWLKEAANNPIVLVGILVGPDVIKVENMSNEEIKYGINILLKKVLGAENRHVEEAVEVIHSTWCTNKYVRGTVSFETVESTTRFTPFQTDLERSLINKLGVPVVLFAGEATHLTKYSTVSGAIESGYREAKRVLHLLNKH